MNIITKEPENIDSNKLIIFKKLFNIGIETTDDQIMAGLQIQKFGPDNVNQYTINLTTKPGYLINEDLNNLESNIFTVKINFVISPKDNVDELITAKEMKGFKTEPSKINTKKLVIIKKVFNTEATSDQDIKKWLLVSKTTSETGSHTLILTAKPGYLINKSETLSSNFFTSTINLNIEKESSININITKQELISLNNTISNNVNLTILPIIKKVFIINDLNDTQDLVDGFKINVINLEIPNTHKLVLTAKPGYVINGISSFESYKFTIEIINLEIGLKNNPGIITPKEMSNITEMNQSIDKEKITIISKLFDINPNDEKTIMNGLWVKRTIHESNNSYKLVLTPKPGFTINYEELSFNSSTFIVIIQLLVTSKLSEEMTINSNEINIMSEVYQDINSEIIEIIQKVFNFNPNSVNNIIEGLQVKKINLEKPNTHKLILKAKQGFEINEQLSELFSNTIINTIDLVISKKETSEILVHKLDWFNAQITIGQSEIDEFKIKVIREVYNLNNITDEELIAGATISKIYYGNNKLELYLIPKAGFTINGEIMPYSSNKFILQVDIQLSSKPSNSINNVSFKNMKRFSKTYSDITLNIEVWIIKKVFNFNSKFVNNNDIKSAFKIRKIQTSSKVYKMELQVVNENYSINGYGNGIGSVFLSNEFTITQNFEISPIYNKGIIVTDDEAKTIGFNNENIDQAKLKIVKKVFNIENFNDDMIIEGLQVKRIYLESPNAHTIVLIAKPGYTINK